uniref:Uncharacterized protein n=1 Tax=Onchocerca volvulus TaxID=6282 RepID=A0A8R1TXG4_ONCVO
MLHRRPNLSRRTHAAEVMQLVIANQMEKERASTERSMRNSRSASNTTHLCQDFKAIETVIIGQILQTLLLRIGGAVQIPYLPSLAANQSVVHSCVRLYFVVGIESVHSQRDSPLRWRSANGCGKLASGQMIRFYGCSVIQIVRLEMVRQPKLNVIAIVEEENGNDDNDNNDSYSGADGVTLSE